MKIFARIVISQPLTTKAMSTEKEQKQENPNRTALRLLSLKARELREEDEELCDCTVNEIVIEKFYAKNGHKEFHLYRDWLQLGYQVKRGSKAFVIWGQKRKATKKQEAPDKEADEFKFYPLAYLFSNKQVEPREQEKAPT